MCTLAPRENTCLGCIWEILGQACLQHYTWVAPPPSPGIWYNLKRGNWVPLWPVLTLCVGGHFDWYILRWLYLWIWRNHSARFPQCNNLCVCHVSPLKKANSHSTKLLGWLSCKKILSYSNSFPCKIATTADSPFKFPWVKCKARFRLKIKL